MARAVSDLASHLGYWLRYVSNHVSQAFARKLEDRDVTVAEWALLRELYGVEALSPSELAEKLGLSRGAISKLAERLINKALVVRHADPLDRRAQSRSRDRGGRSCRNWRRSPIRTTPSFSRISPPKSAPGSSAFCAMSSKDEC